jgi:dTDP-4-dehydrorhamnose 3,5-epimerase
MALKCVFLMRIHVETTPLEGVLVLSHPDLFEDERGFFLEVFRADEFEKLGLPGHFLQENHSRSKRGVVRGLHFQWEKPMAKLMRVTYGSAFLVAVDIRKGSPTLGQWFGTEISAQNKRQLWAPPGFARGFYVLSDFAELQYKCTAIYNPACEGIIRWNDPAIGISWPVSDALLSQKDANAGTLADWLKLPQAEVFRYPESRVSA